MMKKFGKDIFCNNMFERIMIIIKEFDEERGRW